MSVYKHFYSGEGFITLEGKIMARKKVAMGIQITVFWEYFV
jgi:hypothetical protein